MTREEMAEKINDDAGLAQALDDIVHHRHSLLATETNNQGPTAQLKWLEQVCGEDIDDIFSVISDGIS